MGCLGLGGLPCSWMDRAALEMVSTRSRQNRGPPPAAAGLAESPLRGLRRLFFVDVNDCGFVVYQMVQLRRRAVREITTRFKRRGKFVAGESSVVISLGLERVRRAEGDCLENHILYDSSDKLRSESDLGNPCSRRSSTASCNRSASENTFLEESTNFCRN
jgi:hypothetical protein